MLFPNIVLGDQVVIERLELTERELLHTVFYGADKLIPACGIVTVERSENLTHDLLSPVLLPFDGRWRF